MLIDTVTGATPENIGGLVSREQAIGALGQLKTFLAWFEGQEERLTEIHKELNHA